MRVEVVMDQDMACDVSRALVERSVAETLKQSHLALEGKCVRVSVTTVSDSEIQALNRSYRGKDAPTDVLSFPEYADMEAVRAEKDEEMTLGDIILSCDVVKKQAEEDGVSIRREFVYLVSHGVLHLLGFEHGDTMFGIQDVVCDIIEKS